MKGFYMILSLKHGNGKEAVFWKADAAGYTTSPFHAGIYTKQEIESDPHYYSDGLNAVAVELTGDSLKAIGFGCHYDEKKLKNKSRKEVTNG